MGDFGLEQIIGRKLCDAAFTGVIENLLDGYVVIGGTIAGQLGLGRTGGGMDLVWDLWNEQFSAFTYPEYGLSTDSAAGAAGAVHVGFGTGRFNGVHPAWSGTFYGVDYSLSLDAWRVLSISGSVQGFRSPDGAMVGGLVSVGGSASVPDSLTKLIKFPLGGSVTATGGEWTPDDTTTRALTPSNRRRDLVSAGRHTYLNLEEGELGVALHMIHVMGPTPLALGLAAYALAVAMVKRQMEDKGIRDRSAGLQDLHLSLCSQAYRRMQRYQGDVPSGTEERHYDGYSVQRTQRGNYIITSTSSVPATGEWRSTRRLHRPDATLISSHRFGMAIGNAPNGFIDGRSYPRGQFSERVGVLLEQMQRQ